MVCMLNFKQRNDTNKCNIRPLCDLQFYTVTRVKKTTFINFFTATLTDKLQRKTG